MINLQAHVVRLLRARMDKPNVKAGKITASVSMSELLTAFDGMSIANEVEMMRLLQLE